MTELEQPLGLADALELTALTAKKNREPARYSRMAVRWLERWLTETTPTPNATAILTRRVKQGVAEWYVRDLIEKSRRGMEESVRQGWHTGGPAPYGYALEQHPHPNPHKARDGTKKHRLTPDPIRAPIVRMIFDLYCNKQLGLGAICDRLNSDLDRYPPPTRSKKDENDLAQTWSRSQLHAMLRNPKYTGYNVWGRHDKRPGRPSGLVANGRGVPHSLTRRSSQGSSSTKSRSSRAATAIRRKTSVRFATRHERMPDTDAPTRCEAASTAASAGAGWKEVTRRTPTGTAAGSSPSAVRPQQTPPATHAPWGSRKTSFSQPLSTSSATASSDLTAWHCSATNLRKQGRSPKATKRSNALNSRNKTKSSNAPSTGKSYASKNTTIQLTPSSHSQHGESKSSALGVERSPIASESSNSSASRPHPSLARSRHS